MFLFNYFILFEIKCVDLDFGKLASRVLFKLKLIKFEWKLTLIYPKVNDGLKEPVN